MSSQQSPKRSVFTQLARIGTALSSPVRLEFLLPSHETDLATLSRIIDGQLIPLTEDAARHIEVRANGKPVARGELVQLDGQLAVELLQVYRASADE